jgi:uncharacterized protein YaaQ
VIIVQDQLADDLLSQLTANKFSATKIASSGGFLRKGNTTVLVGVENEKTEELLEVIRSVAEERKIKILADNSLKEKRTQIESNGAIVFVLSVEEFYKY